MSLYIISDLHLEPKYKNITAGFMKLADGLADGDQLYILGDFFEYWIGDDISDPYIDMIKGKLKEISQQNIATYFIHGNRDFLIGEQFAKETGITLLPEQHRIDWEGKTILLMHGDELCIDDHEYMAFRKQVRNPAWQEQFLAMSLEERIQFAQQARAKSQENYKAKTYEDQLITDVSETEVEKVLINNGDIDWLIHGHTHRPKVHEYKLNESRLLNHCADRNPQYRIVLGDWYSKGWYLRLDEGVQPEAPKLHSFNLPQPK